MIVEENYAMRHNHEIMGTIMENSGQLPLLDNWFILNFWDNDPEKNTLPGKLAQGIYDGADEILSIINPHNGNIIVPNHDIYIYGEVYGMKDRHNGQEYQSKKILQLSEANVFMATSLVATRTFAAKTAEDLVYFNLDMIHPYFAQAIRHASFY